MSGPLIDRIAHHYLTERPAEAARALEHLPSDEAAGAVTPLAPSLVADLLRRMGSDAAAEVLAALPDVHLLRVMLETDAAHLAGLLALLGRAVRERLVASLPERAARDVATALEFPPGTAGQLMDTHVAPLREETPVAEVLDRVKKTRDRRILDVLLTDDTGRLSGMVSLHELVAAAPGVTAGSVARKNPPFVGPMASRDEVVDLLGRLALASLPVVDLDGRVLGILRFDSLVRAAQQAATDDLQQMVGAGKEERALSKPWLTVKSRLPWLLVNLLTAFTAASVVGLFDATIARITALAVLMPVVAGESGNTGAQALAVTSRGLALREIRVSHWSVVLRKEMLAAAANGATVASVTAGSVLLWSSSPGLAAVIGISMVISMVFAAVAGAVIPILLTALDRDPATASSIMLTTITDVTGFFSFLGLATLMAPWIR